jgi:Nuclease-related domain
MWLFSIVVLIIVFILIIKESKNRKLLETVTKTYRGTRSERDLVLSLLKNGIPAETIFHDLYLKKPSGNFSQIDLAVATNIGILVFEVKESSGWIFGTGQNKYWTQVMAYGKRKYKLYNPIKQNSQHIIDLKNSLKQFEAIPFYSIVVFYGNCVLKDINLIPEGTYLVKSTRVVDITNQLIFGKGLTNYSNKKEVIQLLDESVKNGEDYEIRMKHFNYVKEIIDKDLKFV